MLTISTTPVYASLNRQINHWSQATLRLSALDHLASGNAWHGIEQNLGKLLRQTLQKSIDHVSDYAKQLNRQLESAKDNPELLRSVKRGLIQLRDQYLKAEETIHLPLTQEQLPMLQHCCVPVIFFVLKVCRNYCNLWEKKHLIFLPILIKE